MTSTADRLTALLARCGPAEFSRHPDVPTEGVVTVKLTFPDGDVIAGKGDTTASAVEQLEQKADRFGTVGVIS